MGYGQFNKQTSIKQFISLKIIKNQIYEESALPLNMNKKPFFHIIGEKIHRNNKKRRGSADLRTIQMRYLITVRLRVKLEHSLNITFTV